MPQFESEPILSVVYNSASVDQTYDYSSLSLIEALTDASQVQVRWNVTSVYVGGVEGVGTAQPVSELPTATQEAIYELDNTTQYTVTSENDTITILPAGIENQPVVVGGTTYYYPASFVITPTQNLELRRSTDVTTRVVTFQSGSRLTADLLNLANSQNFNAIQELTQFGVGGAGSIGDVDLSTYSITDLGDVTLAANGLLSWDGSFVTSGSDAGLLVPDPSAAQGGMVLSRKYSPYTGDAIYWKFANSDDITYSGSSDLTTVIGDIATNVSSLQSKTNGFTRDSGSLLTTFSDSLAVGNLDITTSLDITAGDITVTSGDVLIQGESVYDYITHEPYFWQLPSGDSSNITGSTGTRTLGNQTEFASHTAFQYSSSTASADFNFTSGVWTAPRDMVVSVSLTWSLSIQGASSVGYSLGRVRHNGTNVGGPIYNNNDDNTLRRSATKAVVLNVSAGDTITCVVERDGGNTFNAENAEACLHEVR